MLKKKKIIIPAILAIVLAAVLGGVALAADDGDTTPPADTRITALWDEMASVLQNDGISITSDQLQSAFAEAQGNIRAAALQDFLDKLVTEGKITQEQADSYQQWLESRPDMGDNFPLRGGPGMIGPRIRMHGFGGFGGFGGCLGTSPDNSGTSDTTNTN